MRFDPVAQMMPPQVWISFAFLNASFIFMLHGVVAASLNPLAPLGTSFKAIYIVVPVGSLL